MRRKSERADLAATAGNAPRGRAPSRMSHTSYVMAHFGVWRQGRPAVTPLFFPAAPSFVPLAGDYGGQAAASQSGAALRLAPHSKGRGRRPRLQRRLQREWHALAVAVIGDRGGFGRNTEPANPTKGRFAVPGDRLKRPVRNDPPTRRTHRASWQALECGGKARRQSGRDAALAFTRTMPSAGWPAIRRFWFRASWRPAKAVPRCAWHRTPNLCGPKSATRCTPAGPHAIGRVLRRHSAEREGTHPSIGQERPRVVQALDETRTPKRRPRDRAVGGQPLRPIAGSCSRTGRCRPCESGRSPRARAA